MLEILYNFYILMDFFVILFLFASLVAPSMVAPFIFTLLVVPSMVVPLKCQMSYHEAYQKVLDDHSDKNLAAYHEAHNNYVQQLHACNGMLKLYQSDILPTFLEVILF